MEIATLPRIKSGVARNDNQTIATQFPSARELSDGMLASGRPSLQIAVVIAAAHVKAAELRSPFPELDDFA